MDLLGLLEPTAAERPAVRADAAAAMLGWPSRPRRRNAERASALLPKTAGPTARIPAWLARLTLDQHLAGRRVVSPGGVRMLLSILTLVVQRAPSLPAQGSGLPEARLAALGMSTVEIAALRKMWGAFPYNQPAMEWFFNHQAARDIVEWLEAQRVLGHLPNGATTDPEQAAIDLALLNAMVFPSDVLFPEDSLFM